MNRASESGNVFFYILIAIALFGALSFAVSQGNRGNTSLLTDQQARLAAQEIIEYGETVANAVQKLRLRGCSDTEISFENDIVAGYENTNAPSDNSCHVFDVNGGGVNYDNSLGAWLITGNLKIQDLGSSSTNLNLIRPSLQQTVCDNINNILSVTAATIIDDYSGTAVPFNGDSSSYTATGNPTIGDTQSEYDSLTAFCFQRGASNYEFIQTLLTR